LRFRGAGVPGYRQMLPLQRRVEGAQGVKRVTIAGVAVEPVAVALLIL
jgi:hypothetical protein